MALADRNPAEVLERAGFLRLAGGILRSNRVAPTLGRLGRVLGLDPGPLLDQLAAADAAGWVRPWERPGGLRVTLGPVAVAALGVEIDESTYRWVRAGLSSPGPCSCALVVAVDPEDLDAMPAGDGPDADQLRHALAVEDAAAATRAMLHPPEKLTRAERRRRAVLNPPQPILILGLNVQWPVPSGWTPDGRCRGCRVPRRGGRMPEGSYCLVCDRMAIDDLIAEALQLAC